MNQKSFAQGLRNVKFEKRFEATGDGAALAECRTWLQNRGFAVGPNDIRGKYIGAMYGAESVAKWSQLDAEEQSDMHAMIYANGHSFRTGPVTVMLRSTCPLSVVSAFRAEIPDPLDTAARAHVEGAPA